MPVNRAVVTLHSADGNPANFVQNNFAIQLDDPPATSRANAGAGIAAFYDAIDARLSSAIAQNGHTITWYALPGTPPNYPIQIDSMNFGTAPSGTAMPAEVALCVSFQAAKTAGLPQGRRRGRIYLGPFNATQNGTDGRPAATTLVAIRDAYETFTAKMISDGDWRQVVWSEANQDYVVATEGWIDNAWDTQRRRGPQWTARTVVNF